MGPHNPIEGAAALRRPYRLLAAVAATMLLGIAPAASTAHLDRVTHGGSLANIYLLDLDSGRLSLLTLNRAGNEDALAYGPALSPDRSHLAFAETSCHYCSSTIRVASIGARKWLGTPVATGFEPSWSPDGGRLVFVRPDGSLAVTAWPQPRPRVVVRGGLANDTPNWSPRGDRLVFARQLTASDWQIFTVRGDGSGLRAVTRGARSSVDPAWAPDGRRIAFARQDADGRWRICTSAPTGGPARCLGNGGASDTHASWSADGRYLAFVRQESRGSSVWVMRPDGSSLRCVTPPWLDALQPRWSTRSGELVFVGRPRA
jgi:Tol biopolymer transport system component